jgi:hypothetical protein
MFLAKWYREAANRSQLAISAFSASIWRDDQHHHVRARLQSRRPSQRSDLHQLRRPAKGIGMLGFNGRPVDALEWMRTLKLSSNAIRSVTAILFSHTVKGRPEADRSPASKGRGFVVRASVATNQKDEPPMNRGAAGFQEGRLLGVEGDRARRRRGISIRYAVFYRKGNGE